MKLSFIFFFFILFANLSFVLAEENSFENVAAYGCCREMVGPEGGYCQDFPLTVSTNLVCNGAIAATSCSQVPECQLGTCIDSSGYCNPSRVSKIVCESDGGKWFNQDRRDLPQCEVGCCVMGREWSTISKSNCINLYSKYGLNTDDLIFYPGITSETSCREMVDSNKEGACVLSGQEGLKNCNRTYESECDLTGGTFYEGLLCTAKNLNTKCTKTSKKICEGKNVYYEDSCGNLANVVDKVAEVENKDYWEFIIKNPTCTYNKNNPNSCGVCDYSALYSDGNTCDVQSGQAKCVSLACTYEGKTYSNGESWCVSDGGSNIIVNPVTGDFLSLEDRKKIENSFLTENIPGSRYYLLRCYEGKIYQENCRDYRNEVCKQTYIGEDKDHDGLGDFSYGNCVVNLWRDCFSIGNKTECESSQRDCKWLGGETYLWGYRYDGQIFPWNGEDENQKQIRIENQGSCVPLYAPGFDFWSTEEADIGDSQAMCFINGVLEAAVFETGVFTDRDNFADSSVKRAANECFTGGCYAIPDYGLHPKLSNDLYDTLKLHLGRSTPGRIDLPDIYVSERRGYYCDGATGRVTAGTFLGTGIDGPAESGPDCAERTSKRADIPLFLNHGLWIDYIQERARSSGDCGYKIGVSGVYGDENSEKLTVQFQKLKQSGEVSSNKSTKVIYVGDRRVTDLPINRTETVPSLENEDLINPNQNPQLDYAKELLKRISDDILNFFGADRTGYRYSDLFFNKFDSKSFYWRDYNWWKELHKGVTPYIG